MNKKHQYLIVVIILLLTPIFRVEAAECTNDNLSLLKKWAANVNYDYDYVEKDNQVTFKIRFTNLNQNITLKDRYHNKTYTKNNNSEIVIDGFVDGQTYAFELIASDAEETVIYYLTQLIGDKLVTLPMEGVNRTLSCQGQNLTTIYVTLPKYNQFYRQSVCDAYRDHKLCSKWYKHDLTLEEFTKEVQKTVAKEEEKKEEKVVDKTIVEQIIQLYQDRPIVVIGGVTLVIGGLGLLIFLIKKQRETGFEGW